MPRSEFAALLRRAARDEVPRLWRARLRLRVDEFCRYCWPERFGLPFNALHESLFEGQLAPAWRPRRPTIRRAVAAPRGFAKSTISSFARLVHDIVFDREAYIVLMSATQRLSLSLSRDIKTQFELKDTPLQRLFGPFKVSGGVGEWEVSVKGRPSIGLLARSFGTEVRGAKHPTRGIRPTKVVIDDGEKKDRVRNADQRAVWWGSLTKDVLKLAPREGGTIFEVVGTVLHPESMLARLLAEPGWKAEKWQAVQRWPDRMDLWEQAHRIWSDLTLGRHRPAAARAFYESRREEMDAGAELLDPASKSLFELFEVLWSEGLSSFLQELQNDPIDPSAQIFWSERFRRFRIVGDELEVFEPGRTRRVQISKLRKVGWWDPSTGSAHGDFAAIAILGRDEFGYTYVLDVWMRRAVPSVQLDAAWTLAERWGVRRMGVESNGFQMLVTEPFARQREERRQRREFWQLDLAGAAATDDKEARIASLEPDITNGWMVFAEHLPAEVLGQFDAFPTGEHDDGPDVVHGAWKELGGRAPEMAT